MITLHTHYPYPLYPSPISEVYFISLRFTPYSHHHFITDTIHHTSPPPSLLSFRLCIILLHPFGYLSPSLSISPFQFSLTLPFYYLHVQLFFFHPPITSFHLISAIFNFFPFKPPYLTKAKPETSYF